MLAPCKQYVYFQPFHVRSDMRKIYPSPDRHLFAKSTLAEDVDIHFRIIATLFSYNIVVSRACAATHKNYIHFFLVRDPTES